MPADPNTAASYWLSQAIQAAHMLDGWVRAGGVPDLPQHPEMTPHMLRRLADQLDGLAAQTRKAA
jgi:hypothetical protein